MLSSNTFGEFGRKPQGEYMSYLVLKGTVIGGKQVRAGDVVEVDAVEAKELVGIGRITKVVGIGGITKADSKPVETQDRSIGLSEETKPTRRTRRKAK
jgi:hypothetical protein